MKKVDPGEQKELRMRVLIGIVGALLVLNWVVLAGLVALWWDDAPGGTVTGE